MLKNILMLIPYVLGIVIGLWSIMSKKWRPEKMMLLTLLITLPNIFQSFKKYEESKLAFDLTITSLLSVAFVLLLVAFIIAIFKKKL